MMVSGRPRVSTDGQSVDAQAKALRAAGAEMVLAGDGRRENRSHSPLATRLYCLAQSREPASARFGDAWADIATARGRLMLPAWSALVAPAFRALVQGPVSAGSGHYLSRLRVFRP